MARDRRGRAGAGVIREARGMTVVTKWGATPILQDTLRSGGRLGFIADQNAGTKGLFVDFFGRKATGGYIGLVNRTPDFAVWAACWRQVVDREEELLRLLEEGRIEEVRARVYAALKPATTSAQCSGSVR